MTIRSALPLAAFVALLVGISVVLAGVASTVALGAPRGDHLDTRLDSRINADYSPDERAQIFAPLDPGLIDAAREDELVLPEAAGDVEFVPIFRVNPPTAPVFKLATPTPTASPNVTDNAGPEASVTTTPTATPGSTPAEGPLPPRSDESPTPTPVFAPPPPPTSSPKPTPTPTTVPGTTATPKLTANPTPKTSVSPTQTPKPSPTPKLTSTPKPSDTSTPTPTNTPTPSSTLKPIDTLAPTPTPTPVTTPTPTPPPTTPIDFGTLYLHNNPSPPIGNTTSQPVLPMNAQTPGASTLYNYDTDRDSMPGRVIERGGEGADEPKADLYQAWHTAAVPPAVTLPNTVSVTLWTAMVDYTPSKQGSLSIFLRDFDGIAYTTIAAASLTKADWQGGSSTWVPITLTLTTANYTVAPGHRLELKVIVNSQSDDDLWFAYDTTNYQSRIEIQ